MTWDYDKAQLLAKVNDLRDIDRLLEWSVIPSDDEQEYAQIYKRVKLKAWALTEHLFPQATIDRYELVLLTPDTHLNDRMGLLSPAWWMQIDAAIDKL